MKRTKSMTTLAGLGVLIAGLVVLDAHPGDWGLGTGDWELVEEADAVIGRPLTPGSYAGVARRTSRRTTRRAVAATGGYGYGYGAVAALPAGCMRTATGVYACGGVQYRPYYDGPNLVYVPL